MEKASGHRRLAPAIVVALVATAVVLSPLPAAAQRRPAAPPPPHTQTEPSPKPEAAAATIADDSAETLYACDIEDRMGNDEEDMFLDCDGNDDIRPLILDNGNTLTYRAYWEWEPKVTCKWKYAGNIMSGVVVWDLQWPGARSCRVAMQGGDAPCKVVFENRAVTFVTPAGRRVLGDVAIKECSKNWGGFGSLVPFGLGCTYPKHEHPYVGTIEE